MNGTNLLNPCGLIANSFFNGNIHTAIPLFLTPLTRSCAIADQFSLISTSSIPSSLFLDETNIALPSDKASLYLQVSGFSSAPANCTVSSISLPSSAECSAAGLSSGCKCYKEESTGSTYLFYYPNDATTQYLYESYPDQISPLDGVTDEHFIVWMRTSSMPTFRKLYGKIDGAIDCEVPLHCYISFGHLSSPFYTKGTSIPGTRSSLPSRPTSKWAASMGPRLSFSPLSAPRLGGTSPSGPLT